MPATAYANRTTSGQVANGTGAGGRLVVLLGDNSVFDGARVVIKYTVGAVNATLGRAPGEGELSDSCLGHGAKRWMDVLAPDGVGWSVDVLNAGASTNLNLIVVT